MNPWDIPAPPADYALRTRRPIHPDWQPKAMRDDEALARRADDRMDLWEALNDNGQRVRIEPGISLGGLLLILAVAAFLGFALAVQL